MKLSSLFDEIIRTANHSGPSQIWVDVGHHLELDYQLVQEESNSSEMHKFEVFLAASEPSLFFTTLLTEIHHPCLFLAGPVNLL